MTKAKPVRVKSNFTRLKERRRQIEAELTRLDKKFIKLKQLEAELSESEKRYEELNDELETVKQAIREELDL